MNQGKTEFLLFYIPLIHEFYLSFYFFIDLSGKILSLKDSCIPDGVQFRISSTIIIFSVMLYSKHRF